MKGITLFAKASLEALCQLSTVPSIIVTNDWFCGLVPAFVKDKKFFGQTFVGVAERCGCWCHRRKGVLQQDSSVNGSKRALA
jgi:hypothetical protein